MESLVRIVMNKTLVQAVAFWVLLIWLIGVASGLGFSALIWQYKIKEIVKTKTVLISNVVYEVKERP